MCDDGTRFIRSFDHMGHLIVGKESLDETQLPQKPRTTQIHKKNQFYCTERAVHDRRKFSS